MWETSPAKQAKKSIDSLYVQLQENNWFEKTQPVWESSLILFFALFLQD